MTDNEPPKQNPKPLPSTLAPLRSALGYFFDRQDRASARLAEMPTGQWSFGLVGIRTDVQSMSLGEIGAFRVVEEPPGEVELASALKNPALMSAVGRYSRLITHELAINASVMSGPNGAFDLAWWVLSALRTKTLAEFLVPVAADHSWSVIAGVARGACEARLVEDVPQAKRFNPAGAVRESDIQWAIDHLVTFATLLEVPRFRLAVEALTTPQHVFSSRMLAASVWAGIEALLDVKAELRFRLALLAACLLEPRGLARIECYRKMKKMYDVRSKAVHGAAIDNAVLDVHVLEARTALSGLLCKMVEAGRVFTEEELEIALLGD